MTHSFVLAVSIALFFAARQGDQNAKRATSKEQSGFNYELEIDPVQRPAKLSRAALLVLSKDVMIHSCMERQKLSAEDLPANWFIASEIHLDGPSAIDLVVLPGDRVPGTPDGEVSPNACLLGANTGGFWILRATPSGFDLVLSQMAHSLDVLHSRSHGLRDVRLFTISLTTTFIQEFRFDGGRYRLHRTSSRPNS